MCGHLFYYLLNTQHNGLDHHLMRLASLNETNTLSSIVKVFQDVDNAIQQRTQKFSFVVPHNLRLQRLFPVTRSGVSGTFDYLSASGLDGSWLIADRDYLREHFSGKIPLLAFSPEEMDSMQSLLKFFHLDQRKLSLHVKVQTVPRGHTDVHDYYTTFLKQRAPFIRAYVLYS